MLQIPPHHRPINVGESSPACEKRPGLRPVRTLGRGPTLPHLRRRRDEASPHEVLPYSRAQSQPAHLLIVAILQRALDDIYLGGRFRVQAMRWLHEHQQESQPGSFEWCCAALNLDADIVRRRYSGAAFESTTSPS